jgi:biotin carboxyl carrier protein
MYGVRAQVGVFRRGKYAGGKKVGKGNVANEGDSVKKGQTLGYVEQLGTFVDVKVGVLPYPRLAP